MVIIYLSPKQLSGEWNGRPEGNRLVPMRSCSEFAGFVSALRHFLLCPRSSLHVGTAVDSSFSCGTGSRPSDRSSQSTSARRSWEDAAAGGESVNPADAYLYAAQVTLENHGVEGISQTRVTSPSSGASGIALEPLLSASDDVKLVPCQRHVSQSAAKEKRNAV